MSEDTVELIRKAAILNAVRHQGRADPNAVLGSVIGENPSLQAQAKTLLPLIRSIVQEVNGNKFDELLKIAKGRWPEEITREKVEEERRLPPLPNADKYPVIVTRIAPNPDFVLHIGNARAAILSHDYARMYKGKFLVRFEDTDPRLKKAQLQYYDLIREDLRWLKCDWDGELIQSDRIPLYYDVAAELIQRGSAYICECSQESFREQANSGSACPDRELNPETQERRWREMLDGGYGEGQAVFRVKTDLSHPNPAVRDWPGFRVIDTEKTPHPRVGSKYRVWPLYNIASGVDDHEMGVSHIIRGKEHLTNMARQLYLYKHMNWKYPEAVHYGRLKVQGMDLSKSRMMMGVESGRFEGIDDPRLGTLAALRRRGYSPEAIRWIIWDVGPKPVDVTISWDNINSQNRKIIDPTSHRYYFVPSPVLMKIENVRDEYEVKAPLHPQHPEMGYRTLKLTPRNEAVEVYLSGSDAGLLKPSDCIRLMNLFAVRVDKVVPACITATFIEGTAAPSIVPIVQWVPAADNIQASVCMPDAHFEQGLAESRLKDERVGSVIQLVRFGFGRIDSIEGQTTIYFAHQ